MIHDERDDLKTRNLIISVTTIAWGILGMQYVWGLNSPDLYRHHHHVDQFVFSAGAEYEWILMLIAMMAPTLVQPIQFIRSCSLARRRWRSTFLFIVGYLTIWLIAGVLLAFLAALVPSGGSVPIQIGVVASIAIAWQCSPAKQVCLNHCHVVSVLSAFGHSADFDALRLGLKQGIWCAGSCWAWMLCPLVLSNWHNLAMSLTTVLIFCERLDPPAIADWRWRGQGRAVKIILSDTLLLTRAINKGPKYRL